MVVDAGVVVLDGLVGVPATILACAQGQPGGNFVKRFLTHVWGGDLDAANVCLDNLLVIAYRL
jgi:hypothetical protein